MWSEESFWDLNSLCKSHSIRLCGWSISRDMMMVWCTCYVANEFFGVYCHFWGACVHYVKYTNKSCHVSHSPTPPPPLHLFWKSLSLKCTPSGNIWSYDDDVHTYISPEQCRCPSDLKLSARTRNPCQYVLDIVSTFWGYYVNMFGIICQNVEDIVRLVSAILLNIRYHRRLIEDNTEYQGHF